MEVLGGYMNRIIKQIPIEDEIDIAYAETNLENRAEFIFY